MEGLLYPLPLAGGIGAAVAVFILTGAFIVKQFSSDTKKKAEEDKVLLRKLLEGFGLELPSELKEPEVTVIKSIKTP